MFLPFFSYKTWHIDRQTSILWISINGQIGFPKQPFRLYQYLIIFLSKDVMLLLTRHGVEK